MAIVFFSLIPLLEGKSEVESHPLMFDFSLSKDHVCRSAPKVYLCGR